MGKILLGLAALLSLAAPAYALTPSQRAVLFSPRPLMPSAQTFNLGARTPAGYGGCTGSSSISNPLNNLHYRGTRPLSILSDPSGRLTIDAHNCLVPAGTYGSASPFANANATYLVVVSDGHGARSSVTVKVIANRWDITNIDGVAGAGGLTNADTTSSNQFANVLQSTLLRMGDTVAIRAGSVIGSQWLDGNQNATTGMFSLASLRVTRAADATMVAAMASPAASFTGSVSTAGVLTVDSGTLTGTINVHSPLLVGGASSAYSVARQLTGTPGGVGTYQVYPLPASAIADGALSVAYTAQTLPDADWITITDDAPYTATIRHTYLSGVTQQQQGFWFRGLNFEADYSSQCSGSVNAGASSYSPPGCPGFGAADAIVKLGLGGSNPSPTWIRFTDNVFQGRSSRGGQRGQVGIASLTITNNGTSGCTAASVAFYDNGSYPGDPFAAQHQYGSGAAFTAQIAGGVITNWKLVSQGQDYSGNSMADPGTPTGSQNQTYGHVTYSGCTTPPTVTPNMNGYDVVTGIYGQASTGYAASGGVKELDIEDNLFVGLTSAIDVFGNLNGTDVTPSDFFIIGNRSYDQWTNTWQLNGVYPAYVDWNFVDDIQYQTGLVHTDCEIDQVGSTVANATYYFGERIGNICIRGAGDNGHTGLAPTIANIWADAAGEFMGGVQNGVVFQGCRYEGDIYVGTYVNGLYAQNCDSTGMIAFNTIIQDPAGSYGPGTFSNLTQFATSTWTAATPGVPTIVYTATSTSPPATSPPAEYNAIATPGVTVTRGATPTQVCNQGSIGFGQYASAFAAAPSFNPVNAFPSLQTPAQVQAAFATKANGLLSTSQTGCAYDAGAGSYFDYVDRVSTAPF